ncbi:hypothetical protein [Loigolactobacillus jiayinensis]|uniref:Uncharacterized protein n=1 Tax=Loigolactobacillus jiayinensis TaxID=2486016 RepID=A0ABW1RCI1_9LACO|nr:hypothetical protein [Loigolactobacillus jiayinensis]
MKIIKDLNFCLTVDYKGNAVINLYAESENDTSKLLLSSRNIYDVKQICKTLGFDFNNCEYTGSFFAEVVENDSDKLVIDDMTDGRETLASAIRLDNGDIKVVDNTGTTVIYSGNQFSLNITER